MLCSKNRIPASKKLRLFLGLLDHPLFYVVFKPSRDSERSQEGIQFSHSVGLRIDGLKYCRIRRVLVEILHVSGKRCYALRSDHAWVQL